MAMEGTAKLCCNKKNKQYHITIPSKVANDSAFPFEIGDMLIVKISFDKIILERKTDV